MLKAYRYRIYPNAEQKKAFAVHFGHTRHVYNWALALKIQSYEETGKSLSRKELQNQLVQLKKTDKPWLKEVNSQSLLAALLQVETAYKNFFEKRCGFPSFKKKYQGHQAYQCPQHATVDFVKAQLHLPKIKSIAAVFHRPFTGKIKTVTIKKTPSEKYYASVLVDDGLAPIPASPIEANQTLGLDIGLRDYLIDSNGNKTPNPRLFRKSQALLAKKQRQFSRKTKKDSKNRAKEKISLARLHEKVRLRRQDFVHQLSASLVYKNHETSFAIEDLHIKGMIKNRKLSKAITDSGWRQFINAIGYKCKWHGKNLLSIDRFAPSSKTCHVCGAKRDKLPLSVREWQCDDCGARHDRDINAARNIKAFALADAQGQGVCVKQFPCS